VDLPVATLGQRNLKPRVLGLPDQPDGFRTGQPAVQSDPLAQLLDCFLRRKSADLDRIGLGNPVLCGEKFIGKITVVSQNQQPLGVVVEPSDRVQSLRGSCPQQVHDSGPPFGVIGRCDAALGLVHRQIPSRAAVAQDLAVDAHGVMGSIRSRAELSGNLAVDRDAAG